MCWGLNQNGQLGNAIPSASPNPVDVIGALGAAAIATGEDHACALTAGGVKCWGRNVHDALGNGSAHDSFVPVDVLGLGSPVTAVRAGGYSTCAIDTAGGVVCWGWELRTGSPMLVVPMPVPGLASGVADVTLGTGHICALTSSGGVKCWGDNQAGQLGSGFGGFETTPVTVSALTEAAFTLDGGDLHSCAQTASFGMACWGANNSAQLGIGHTYPTSGAATVPLSTGTLAVATGASHSCQLGGGGTVRCWGLNEQGQVGIGTTDRALRPTQVPGIAGANAVSASGYHSCSLMGDGSVKCWGNNANGQLGNGLGGYATSPQTVLLASCGGFGDVVAGNPFCANVEWNRNRLVTLGCAPELFCASIPVSRIAMSAFMNRLATALTPTTAIQQGTPGALDPSVAVVVCATTDHPTGSQPRRAYLDAVFGAIAAADVTVAVRLVWSPDGGLSWYGFSGGVNGVARAGRWTNLRMLDSLDLADGYDIRYGMEVSRGGLPGTGTLIDSTCNLRVRIDNRDAPGTQ